MKYLAAALILAFAVGIAILPSPEPAQHESQPATAVPPISVCPIVEVGGRSTNVAVLSSVNGLGRLTTFAAGGETGSLEFRTGGSGSVVVPAVDAGAIGVSGGLVELPSDATAAGVLVNSPDSMASESCADIPTSQAALTGGSTASGSAFELQLLNPYAGEATLEVTVTTDAGIESDSRFDSVIVPPLTSLTLDLTTIIPGRESIGVDVETTRGSVLVFGRQTIGSETAIWRAVAPGQDWWLPVPGGADPKQLLISSVGSGDVEYQVDLYGPEGLQEAFETGVLGSRGQARIPLDEVTTTAAAFRIIATGPVVADLWMQSETGLAATSASPVDAPVWLLPGAAGPAGGSGSAVVLNSGLEEVTVTLRSLTDQSLTRDFTLPSERVLSVDLVAANGYRIESTGPIVALWTSQLGAARTAALGVPIQDG